MPDPADVSRLFGDIAVVYDRMNGLMSLGLDTLWRRELVRLAGIEPGTRTLDVCCGTGDVAIESARRCGPRGSVVASDFSAAMLEGARLKVARLGLTDTVTLVEADALNLPFAACSFGAVTVAFGVRNFADIPRGFHEMLRVLSPGGTMACLDLSRPTLPGFREAYAVYFDRLVPLLGRAILGSRGPYDYLPASLREFPVREQLAGLMRSAGFTGVRYREMALGTVAIHWGVKPVEPEGALVG